MTAKHIQGQGKQTVLRIQSGTVIPGQTESSSDSNYEWPEIT